MLRPDVLQLDVVRAFDFARVHTHGALGVRSHYDIYLNDKGSVVRQVHNPHTQTSWNKLYSALHRHLPARHYSQGAELVGLEQSDSGVVAIFANGRRAEADILIGADGSNSTVRKLMLPEATLSCGLVDEARLPDAAKPHLYENFVFQHDPASMMLQYMIPGRDGAVTKGQRRFNWLWYRKVAPGPELDAVLTDADGKRREHAVEPGALAATQKQWFRRTGADRVNPALQALIEKTDDIFVQEIQDLQVSRLVFGRVLLTGDAAFIPRPHTAGSTAKAACNAVALAKALANSSNVLAARLAAWEQEQIAGGMRMTNWGIRMGNRIMGITHTQH
ncbi:FAD-dependent monooxygenase [Cupriavidus sp. D39]|uniref:FAD binding domain-containing protein n=1 Tax=Cupriavidus sp. D39 TaxID=2997877 RepID=UPI00226ED711|nr:FAD-dependent monooxygenase [Cupriavidus sp. D39]MCY0852590.1 FAD-dependent monooxygenase [Cupriavidus sp. D39]